jgi:hypothetical protein
MTVPIGLWACKQVFLLSSIVSYARLRHSTYESWRASRNRFYRRALTKSALSYTNFVGGSAIAAGTTPRNSARDRGGDLIQTRALAGDSRGHERGRGTRVASVPPVYTTSALHVATRR